MWVHFIKIFYIIHIFSIADFMLVWKSVISMDSERVCGFYSYNQSLSR